MDNNQYNNQNNNQYNNQNNVFGQPMMQKAPSKINIPELIALICAGIGLLMTILGTIFTCTCSAKKYLNNGKFSLSPVFIVTIFGILFAIAAVIFAIVALKQKNVAVKAGKLSWVSLVVGCFAALMGFLPLVTICGYNCSLSKTSTSTSTSYDDWSSLYNYFN